jgi:hypothetical protein
MLLQVIKLLWSHQNILMMGRQESGALTGPKHLSQEPHYFHDETSDASTNPVLKHIHNHGCVLEDDVSVIKDMEEATNCLERSLKQWIWQRTAM